MLDRLFQNWAYATPPVALLVLGLYPFIGAAIEPFVFLSLPIYMVHQFEEHDSNRFALYLNAMIGEKRRGLTALKIWIINVIFVWFLLLAVLYLSNTHAAWGVLAAYLLVVNGCVHGAWALKFRAYNPGLWTAIFSLSPVRSAILIFARRAA